MASRLMPFNAPPRAFISYARSDGSDIAATLRSRLQLEHPEITLWLDRAQMVGGVGWWTQITEALDQVEILIMVLTPAAARSKIAAKEWRYARQQGVRVCPVFRQSDLPDFRSLPTWMRKAHCYDLDKEWATFIAFLQSGGREARVPFMAPDLPENYVARPTQRESLLAFLLDGTGESPRSVTVALHGPGGFGKTSLACDVCHAENVISGFDDGVLWASLGETPNIQGELTKLYAALTGKRPPFVDVDDASIQLATRLDEKNCLIVVDDVWDVNHLKPFMRGGKQCARLITTRQLSVTIEVGAKRTVVEKMTNDQAVSMLTSRIAAGTDEQTDLKALAHRLGEWPLLLKLAGSQLKERMERGDSLRGALAFVNGALNKRGIAAFDRSVPSDRNDAVASTVGASLELFSGEDRMRCAELAVLRNDETVPLDALSVLWGLDDFDTEDLVQRLDNAALLEFDVKTASIRVHGVLRTYLESLLEDPEKLHWRLASSWLRERLDLPNSYAWTWIGWHLVQAGAADRLRDLLLDFDWLRARTAAVPVQVLLEDFDLLDESPDLRTIRDTLQLALPGLTFDSRQLCDQLVGRIGRGKSERMDRLLRRAESASETGRLTPADTSLTHPGGALQAILKSHGGRIGTLAVSPDGRWAVSGSEDWTLRLWDLQASRVVRAFEGHAGAVHAAAFAANGRILLSGSEDRTIRVWDVHRGVVKRTFRGHTLAVQSLAVTPDGSIASSVSEDGTVRIWDLEHEQSWSLFHGRHHQLSAVAISSDGSNVVFGAGDWTIRSIHVSSGTETVFDGHAGIVRAVTLTPDAARLVSGADDRSVRTWLMSSGEPLGLMTGHRAEVDCVAVTSDGTKAISGCRDRSVRVWDIDSGEAVNVLEGHSGHVTSVAISPISGQVISASTDGTIRRWNVDSALEDTHTSGHSAAVSLLSMSSDGSTAVSGAHSEELQLWECSWPERRDDSRCESVLSAAPRITARLAGHSGRVRSLRIIANGKEAVTCSQDRTLRLWDFTAEHAVGVLKGHSRAVLDVDVSADGVIAVSLSADRTLRAWSLKAGRCTRVLVSEDNERTLSSLRASDAMLAELDRGPRVDVLSKRIPRDASFGITPDGSKVLLGFGGNLFSWDLNTGARRNTELSDFDVVSIAVDARSKQAIAGSRFGQLLLWNFSQACSMLEGHQGRVLDAAIGPDGKTAVSAASDDSIRIWDLESEAERARITGPLGKVDAVVIAADADLAYSIYGDTIVAYDTKAARRHASLSFDHQITALTVTPSGRRVAVGDQSGRVHFLSLV